MDFILLTIFRHKNNVAIIALKMPRDQASVCTIRSIAM